MLKIAIVIPTYNAESTIVETLKSIDRCVNDNLKVASVYIADDLSSDLTIKKCEETWQNKNTRFTILKYQKNVGERGNLNRAFVTMKDKYDWALILHADDLAKVDWLDEMCLAMEMSDKNIVSISSSYDVVYADGRIEAGENNTEISTIEGNQESMKDTLKSGTWWHVSGCAVNLRLFFISGGFHNHMPQYGDMEWVLRIFNLGFAINYLPKSLTTYRQSEGSVSSKSFVKHLDIYEYANLIVNYRYLFTNQELKKSYIEFNRQLLRRQLKSIWRGDINRLSAAMKMSIYLFKLFFVAKEPDIDFESDNFLHV